MSVRSVVCLSFPPSLEPTIQLEVNFTGMSGINERFSFKKKNKIRRMSGQRTESLCPKLWKAHRLNSQLIRLKPYKCPNYRKSFNWTDNQPTDKNILKPGLISSIHHQLFTSFLLYLLQTRRLLLSHQQCPFQTLTPLPFFLSLGKGDGEGDNCHLCPHHVHLSLWLLGRAEAPFCMFLL